MILEATAQNAMCNALVDLLDGGTGAGYIEFQIAAGTEVATLPLSAVAFGDAAAGIATAAAITNDSSATGNVAAVDKLSFYDGDAVKHFSVTAGTGAAEANFNKVIVDAGDEVSIASMTIEQPSS